MCMLRWLNCIRPSSPQYSYWAVPTVSSAFAYSVRPEFFFRYWVSSENTYGKYFVLAFSLQLAGAISVFRFFTLIEISCFTWRHWHRTLPRQCRNSSSRALSRRCCERWDSVQATVPDRCASCWQIPSARIFMATKLPRITELTSGKRWGRTFVTHPWNIWSLRPASKFDSVYSQNCLCLVNQLGLRFSFAWNMYGKWATIHQQWPTPWFSNSSIVLPWSLTATDHFIHE